MPVNIKYYLDVKVAESCGESRLSLPEMTLLIKEDHVLEYYACASINSLFVYNLQPSYFALRVFNFKALLFVYFDTELLTIFHNVCL